MRLRLGIEQAKCLQSAFVAAGVTSVDGVRLDLDGDWGDSSREAAKKLRLRIYGMSTHHVGKLNNALVSVGLLPEESGIELVYSVYAALLFLESAVSERGGECEAKTQTEEVVDLPYIEFE